MRTLLLALALTLSTVGWAEDPPPAEAPAADAPAQKTAAELVTRFDELWKTRDAADSIKELNDLIKTALAQYPTDYELLWRTSRFRWWTADGLTDEKSKRAVAKEAWNYAGRATAAKADGWEGKYYTALSIGAYSQAVGVLKALTEGLEPKFVENLDASIKNNEGFDRFGGHVAKGRYYWELPWPKRDLKKSKEELNKAIAAHPEHLRAHYFLAATLLKDGDAKGAKVENDKALNGDASYDPPEARRVKGWAKTLGADIDKELK